MGRKKKLFTGVKPIGVTRPIKSLKMARKVTHQYHNLRDALYAINRDESLTVGQKMARKEEILGALEAMGGTSQYQEASIITTSHFKTSKWVTHQLTRHFGVNKTIDLPRKSSNRLKMLEIGAVNIHLQKIGWLDTRSIDVHPKHPSIEQKDFFDMDPQATEEQYDIIVNCMVINCVVEPFKRGEMLLRLRSMLAVDSKSLLLLVLPTHCLKSKHVGGVDNFQKLLSLMGFLNALPRRSTPKLTFFSVVRSKDDGLLYKHLERKTAVLVRSTVPKELLTVFEPESKVQDCPMTREMSESGSEFSIKLPSYLLEK